MYLPALEAVDGTDLGLALVNSGSTEAQVTVTVRTYDGVPIANTALVNPHTLQVPPSGKLEVRLVDLFGTGISGQHGWLEITPSTPDVKAFSFVFDSALSFVEGVDVTSATSNQIVFPKISQESGSTLHVVNTSPQPVEATISLYDNAGHIAAVLPLSLAGLAGVSRSVNDRTQANPGFEGYAIVQTTGSVLFAQATLVGFETYRNQSDFAVMRGIPVSAQMRNGYWSYFASQAGYSSRLTLINTTDGQQVVQITADGTPGTVSVTKTLLPHGRIEQSAADIFGLSGSSLIDGNVRFETQTNTSGVFGVLEYGTTDGTSLSAAEAQPQPQSDFYFLHLAEGGGYYTGLAFLNPNLDPSIVLLDLFDKSGLVTASTTVELSPGERRSGLVDEFFANSISQICGYIRASTAQPVFAQ
jgi:hypothetical protein